MYAQIQCKYTMAALILRERFIYIQKERNTE